MSTLLCTFELIGVRAQKGYVHGWWECSFYIKQYISSLKSPSSYLHIRSLLLHPLLFTQASLPRNIQVKMQLTSALALLLTLAATTATAKPTVYLIRHGEKPSDGGNGLSAQGVQRAQCLRTVFGASSQYNIGYILAQTPKASGKRARPRDTVAPVAKDLGLTVDTSCDRDDPVCVRDSINAYSGSGNGESIRDIYMFLGQSTVQDTGKADCGDL